MIDFWIGFAAGVLANQVFAMLVRLLPATWVRYKVILGKPYNDSKGVGECWVVPISIIPPRWKRAIMEPLIEYLLVEVLIDGEWYESKWIVGDVNEIRLRGDGAMTVSSYLFHRMGHVGNWIIADEPTDDDSIIPLSAIPKSIKVRVYYSLDNKTADEKSYQVCSKSGEIESIG